MVSSEKVVNLENHTQNGEWTVVLPRKGRHRRNSPKLTTPKLTTGKGQQQEQQPWVPTDVEIDSERQSKLMHKIQVCMKRIENSRFLLTLLDQMQSAEVFNHFSRILGSELKLQMVIYGIGSIESHETPRLQLSLAVLMKRRFSWIGDIEVFDPVLSATESQVLEALGCSVLSVNEQGRRQAMKPTLFFMPHCEAELYNNLLQANWGVEPLNRVALFGNSFETYEQHVSFKYYEQEVSFMDSSVAESVTHILAARRFTDEFKINTVSDDYFAAFHDSSWHFFKPACQNELQLN
ncbi:Sensitivity To Red Light Reduced-like, SRR1 [Corchorus olitorius]|uniref:Sensitivity To Red Light Reduced-like, SRR1 n=1 Tax=Corchorus olitorius TaxID=93759 RepID=A0A1R3KKI5_9ROSI|nr:Sensitivity To Red Light Reduced-like, SRR1 [Corchorus olitorius]